MKLDVLKQTRTVQFVAGLCKRLGAPLPSPEDTCAWMLLTRAVDEMQGAQTPDVFEAKAQALLVLVKHGWTDVFKESLRNGRFKSEEEAGRFGFCLSSTLSKTEPS